METMKKEEIVLPTGKPECGFGDRLRVIPWEANFLFELELLSWKLGDEKVIKKVCEAGIWIISEIDIRGQVLGPLEELKDMLGTVQRKKEVKLNGHMFSYISKLEAKEMRGNSCVGRLFMYIIEGQDLVRSYSFEERV